MQGTNVTSESSKADGAVTVPVIATFPSSAQDALIVEREKIPELQVVVPNLNPGHDAVDVGIKHNDNRQAKRMVDIMVFIVYIF